MPRPSTGLKRGSIQLHKASWDFIERRTMPGILTSATIIRKYVLDGIRKTLIEEVKQLTPGNLHNASNGIISDLYMQLCLMEKESTLKLNKSLKEKYGDEVVDMPIPEYSTMRDYWLFRILNDENREGYTFEELKNIIIEYYEGLSDTDFHDLIAGTIDPKDYY